MKNNLTNDELLLIYEMIKKEIDDIDQHGHLIGNSPYKSDKENTECIRNSLVNIINKLSEII